MADQDLTAQSLLTKSRFHNFSMSFQSLLVLGPPNQTPKVR